MSTVQAIFIAILQGATELFPISSLGHAVVLPALLGWDLNQRSPEFLPFLVLIAIYGDGEREKAALRFFIYTSAGSLSMLVSIAFLFVASGSHSSSFPRKQEPRFRPSPLGSGWGSNRCS